MISEDNLFTSGQRAKLLHFDDLAIDNVFVDFVNAIKWYLIGTFDKLDNASYELFRMTKTMQVFRISLASRLRSLDSRHDLDDIEKQEEAIETLDEIVEEMQEQYANVTEKYIDLKRKLTS